MSIPDTLLHEARNVPAGPALDRLIGEQLMGQIKDDEVPLYSTDMVAAWPVVETLVRTEGLYFGAPHFKNKRQSLPQLGYPGGTECWYCVINTKVLNKVVVCADTAPLAICRAAMLWVRTR